MIRRSTRRGVTKLMIEYEVKWLARAGNTRYTTVKAENKMKAQAEVNGPEVRQVLSAIKKVKMR